MPSSSSLFRSHIPQYVLPIDHLPVAAVGAGQAGGAAAERRQIPRLVHLNGGALRGRKAHAREV